MRYTVQIAARARRDLLAAYEYIAEDSTERADHWLDAVTSAISSLADFPQRCPPALESSESGETWRQLVLLGYRVIFTARGDVVTVLHVRHASRKGAAPDEVC